MRGEDAMCWSERVRSGYLIEWLYGFVLECQVQGFDYSAYTRQYVQTLSNAVNNSMSSFIGLQCHSLELKKLRQCSRVCVRCRLYLCAFKTLSDLCECGRESCSQASPYIEPDRSERNGPYQCIRRSISCNISFVL